MTEQQLLHTIYLELQEEGINSIDYTHFTEPYICIPSQKHKLNAYLEFLNGEIHLTTSDPHKRPLLVLELTDPQSIPTLIKELKQWQT
jgi:hypothetical protein